MDELQRLAVCVQEGVSNASWVKTRLGAVKIKLATRQLRFLYDSVSALAKPPM
jgi:hypothetical protein